MISSPDSLLKYDHPVLVSTDAETTPAVIPQFHLMESTDPVPPEPHLPIADTNQHQTREVLNFILPPREFCVDNQSWVQQVSSTPCTRAGVILLQKQLDKSLKERHAKETGICPARRELYSQCFDEIMRQVTINCYERGFLLLKIRDEMRLTISAYQERHDSSTAFGIRKAHQGEESKFDMENKILQLDREKKDLERLLNEQKAKCQDIERRVEERREIRERKHMEDVQFYERTNKQLKEQLETMTAMKNTR